MKRKAVLVLSALLLLMFMFTACASGEEEEIFSYFTPGDYIVTNTSDSFRLLKAAPVLVISGHDLEAEADFNTDLTSMVPAMRDAMNIVLRAKTEAELKAPGIMDQLRGEIVQVLKDKLGMDYVINVYFNDFVVQ